MFQNGKFHIAPQNQLIIAFSLIILFFSTLVFTGFRVIKGNDEVENEIYNTNLPETIALHKLSSRISGTSAKLKEILLTNDNNEQNKLTAEIKSWQDMMQMQLIGLAKHYKSETITDENNLKKLQEFFRTYTDTNNYILHLVSTGQIEKAKQLTQNNEIVLVEQLNNYIKKLLVTEEKYLQNKITGLQRNTKRITQTFILTGFLSLPVIILIILIINGVVNKEKKTARYARKLVELSTEPIISVNEQGKITDVNKAVTDMTGISPAKQIGTEFFDYFTDLNKAREAIRKLFSTGTYNDFPLKLKHTSGHVTPVLFNTAIYNDTKGKKLGVFTGKRDLIEIIKQDKELKEYRESLEKIVAEKTEDLEKTLKKLRTSNEELEQFAYIASHDLQEPLRMVSSYTQLLARRYKDKLDDDANDFINYAVDGANRMQQLITDLLEYSRITTRGKEFSKVELDNVLGIAVANLNLKIRETHTIITNDNLPVVSGDEMQLVRVFQNLIDNAIKFKNDEDPRIHVGAKEEDAKVTVWVKDNGMGIDHKFHNRIFTIFQRLNKRNSYSGTGIGLSVCKRTIERHGGKIWFESELNKGTTFYFTLKT